MMRREGVGNSVVLSMSDLSWDRAMVRDKMKMNVDQLVRSSRDLLGLELTPDMQRAFSLYADELLAWNQHTNLTAITEPEAIEMRHFLDSLAVIQALPLLPSQRVIDVGTGAGFPGLPLRLIRAQIELTLLEATAKKTDFLTHVVKRLNLNNVRILNARAEDAGQDTADRERHDVVLARAVAQMPVLAEYLLPLCKVGGRCVALKGESAVAEAQQAEHALRILGGRLEKVIAVELPQVAETHYLVVIEKIAATPDKYPRRAGMPSKRPLGD
jgi:16S rRNA (guanine527-N7)-methyltransferase